MKQSAGEVRIRLSSQSINNISSVLQKLLRYFNGATVLTSFVPSIVVCSACYFCFKFKRNTVVIIISRKICNNTIIA